ncbi:hypothetical protein ACEWPL_016820 [Roseovarius sp. S1116L3]|uniref:hypothetical protein n=1 Tax=Roseovarius roseus TaxID=3342636 RepID=UPI0037294C4B
MPKTSPVFRRLPALFSGNRPLRHRSRHANFVFLIGAGNAYFRFILCDSCLRLDEATKPMQSWDMALRGDENVWADHWKTMPPADAADILGMQSYGRLVIEGNLLPLLQNLQVIKDILALPRQLA